MSGINVMSESQCKRGTGEEDGGSIPIPFTRAVYSSPKNCE